MTIYLRAERGEPLAISREVAEQWDWFRPILQGKFLSESTHEVPLESSLLQNWYELATTAAGETLLPLHHYEDVSEALLFFAPSNEEWRAYVDVQELNKNERLTHYKILGRHIRQQGTIREWMESLTNAPVHCNFFCRYDPVYPWSTPEVYGDQLTPSIKAAALQHEGLSIITGIMQCAWVSQMVDGGPLPGHEVSWQYIDWAIVGEVEYPNKLFDAYVKADSDIPISREAALELLNNGSEDYRLTYAQAALVYSHDPDGDGHKNYGERGLDMATHPSRVPGSIPIELSVKMKYDEGTDKTEFETNVDNPLELYGILLRKLANDDFKSYVIGRRGYDDVSAEILSGILLRLCGATDLITPQSPEDVRRYSSYSSIEDYMWSSADRYRRMFDRTQGRPIYSICETITTLLLRRGRALKSATQRNEDQIPEEDYEDIIKYAISVVGSETVADLASVIAETDNYGQAQRLLKFAEKVYDLLPEEPVEGEGF